MDRPAAFICTQDAVYWSKTSNVFADIVEEHGLRPQVSSGNTLYAELRPVPGTREWPPRYWHYRVYQSHSVPPWADEKRDEARCRKQLAEWLRFHYCVQAAGDAVAQVAYSGARQEAQHDSFQRASVQNAGRLAIQEAGPHSHQIAGYGGMQKAGVGSTQILWCFQGDEWMARTRTVTEDLADQWHRLEQEGWRECTITEIRRAENALK